MKNLRALNLNLLPVLRELLRHKNVTYTGEVLNMSQSAVSESLSRLRHLFKDELLVQEGRALVLTALAERLEPILDDALNRIEYVVGATNFDAATVSGAIRVAAADYVVLVLGTTLVRRLRQTSPGVTVQFQDLNKGVISAVRRGLLDLVLVPEVTTNETWDELDRALVFEDDIVCVVDAGSPIQGQVDEEAYWAAKHIFFTPRSDVFEPTRPTVLQQMGDRRLDSALVPSYLLLPFFVEKTDVIAMVPRRLAERLAAAAEIRIVDPPFTMPKMRIHAVWSRSRTRDPLHKWFREAMFDVARQELAETGA